jgi:hypothetical protein
MQSQQQLEAVLHIQMEIICYDKQILVHRFMSKKIKKVTISEVNIKEHNIQTWRIQDEQSCMSLALANRRTDPAKKNIQEV